MDPAARCPSTHRLIGSEDLAQQVGDGALCLHGGVLLSQVEGDAGRTVTVQQPRSHRQDALLHVGGGRQAAQLLEGDQRILRAESSVGLGQEHPQHPQPSIASPQTPPVPCGGSSTCTFSRRSVASRRG